jgi:hypothetical protein
MTLIGEQPTSRKIELYDAYHAIRPAPYWPRLAHRCHILLPGPRTGEVGSAPISATTPAWSTSHGPRNDAPAIHTVPGAVVEA